MEGQVPEGSLRRTTRTTAGVPPPRLGQETSPSVQADQRSVVSRSASVSSRRSDLCSVRINRVELQTAMEVNALEETLEEEDRAIGLLEMEVQTMLEEIQIIEEAEPQSEEIKDHRKAVKTKMREIERRKLNLKFNEKSLIRKKILLEKQQALSKSIIEFEENSKSDNSIELSDTERELDPVKDWLSCSRSQMPLSQEKDEMKEQLQAEKDLSEAKFAKASADLATREALQAQLDLKRFEDDEKAKEEEEFIQRQQAEILREAKREQLRQRAIEAERKQQKQPAANTPVSMTVEDLVLKMTEAFGNVNKPNNQTQSDKFLARQAHGKELPSFSGHPEEWIGFYSAFKETTGSCGFTDSENMERIRKCVKGDAAKTIQCLMISPSNLNEVIETLRTHYGQSEHIIRNLIQKAKTMAPVRVDQLSSLIEFGTAVRNLSTTITALNQNEHLNNPQLLFDMESKLPAQMVIQWREWIVLDSTRKKNLSCFSEWLKEKTAIACSVCPPRSYADKDKPVPFKRNRQAGGHVLVAEEKNSQEKKCAFCSLNGHKIQECRKFQKEAVGDRFTWIKDKRLCFNCLNFGHRTKDCKFRGRCGQDGCERKHHRLIHKESTEERKGPSIVAVTTQESRSHSSNQVPDSSQSEFMAVACSSPQITVKRQCAYNVIPVILRGPKREIHTYAMLDSGSAYTLIDSSVARQLGLRHEKSPFTFRGLDSDVRATNSSFVDLDILSNDKKKQFSLSSVRTYDNLQLPCRTVSKRMISKYSHLNGINLSTYENARPMILLGQEHPKLIVPTRRIVGPGNSPIAAETELGWVLNGHLSADQPSHSSDSVLTIQEDYADLHDLVKYHFTTEAFGVKVTSERPRSVEDKRAKEIMDRTARRVEDRWEIGLLWKSDAIILPESKSNALRRLYSIEKKMDRQPHFAQRYCEKLSQYEEKGYIRKLTKEETACEGSRTWYLPHFGHLNPNKPEKLRLVFDGASKSHGVSLNDHLLKGEDQLVALPTVLYKFREREIAVAGDIKEMFHQVRIRKEDQDSQRLLWRGLDRNRDPDVYVLPVMFFGSSSSPSCAQEIKNRNAREWSEEFPSAVDAIIRKHYVDDYLDSLDTVEQAKQRVKEVIELHRRGGFQICNWISNSSELLESISPDLRAKGSKNLYMDTETSVSERVLGMHWNPVEDVFMFETSFSKIKREIIEGHQVPTKREALAMIMSLYDPLGLLAHFTVQARIILQEAWRSGIGWDDELPSSSIDKWNRWIYKLKEINTFKLPRCYSSFYSSSETNQLHVFVDASEHAYAAVAYFRTETGGAVHTSLIAAKSRVAPLKPLGIPKMELQAAILGVRLARSIREEHESKIQRICYWSDSKTVLYWMQMDGRRLLPFMAHRIGEIQELSSVSEWGWVPTKENVADEATRDVKPSDWSPTSRWINGPEFLKNEEDTWPIKKCTELDKSEVDKEQLGLKKEYVTIIVRVEPVIEISRFSSWIKLIRVTARVFKFIKKLKSLIASKNEKGLNNTYCSMEISVADMKSAEVYWCRNSQEDSFKADVEKLREGSSLNNRSRLWKVTPFLDQEGLLRVKGRISAAVNIGQLNREPIILDDKHPYTILLIRYHHERAGHHGHERVTNELRETFYIPCIRSAVRRSWSNCQKCKNARAQPAIPKMGNLPAVRLEHHIRPFTVTGMDYFGPVEVTVGRHHEKRYGVLFTCMSTRAVHIEIAHSLTTDSCIMSIRRFIGRRGSPREMFSDNGTNLRGACSELKEAIKDLNQKKMKEEITIKGIEWHFIPPVSSHMGGSWERLVKSVKTALYAILKDHYPKDEVLQTLIIEAEHVVNSRPLTHVPIDPDDPSALTPNNFLLGELSNVRVPGKFEEADLCLRKQWRVAQRLADHFWRRWIQEYLPDLTRRNKWYGDQKPIRVGDVVIIIEDKFLRNSWIKGIVTKVFPGNDGLIRVADVKTAIGEYRRPVAKLAVLDVRKD